MKWTPPSFSAGDASKYLIRWSKLYPKVNSFKEILPMASKDRVVYSRDRPAASTCVQELQALFSCMKKWEFDDLQCTKFHDMYNRCVEKSGKMVAAYREAAKKGIIGEGDPNAITTAQFNKLMKLYPQPDLGTHPYRQMQRSPMQSYADDIYRRKDKKGKPS